MEARQKYMFPEKLLTTSSSIISCNISNNHLEISNFRKAIDNGLERLLAKYLEQSCEKDYIAKEFKDIVSNKKHKPAYVLPQLYSTISHVSESDLDGL